MAKIMLVVGTRPEAIKLAPVIHALTTIGSTTRICVTGQHPTLAGDTLRLFGIQPDIALPPQSANSLDMLSANLIGNIGAALDAERPDRLIVQGDTTSAFIGALAAHNRHIPVGHVEAGLRSGDLEQPWPEEGNRRMISSLTDLHFAPTQDAASALRAENIAAGSIHITGNTGIDALRIVRDREEHSSDQPKGNRRLILVTCHRRESFGSGLNEIAKALREVAQRSDVAIVLPLHPNPEVATPLRNALTGLVNVTLTDPLDYPEFVRLLASAHIVLTDSGGVQEEAPAFGKPVLILRDKTERIEGVRAGTARLVGNRADNIVAETCALLDDPRAYARMARAHNPYGDGRAAERIARIIAEKHGLSVEAPSRAVP